MLAPGGSRPGGLVYSGAHTLGVQATGSMGTAGPHVLEEDAAWGTAAQPGAG